ncbi:MAG: hypothetical protein IPL06_12335 [Betaproteobacteria bacterium]|nr:hypothetical protein [Betaproteobacteria bacterium]
MLGAMRMLRAHLDHLPPGEGGVIAEFRNRIPSFLWGFAVAWYALVAAFTWIVWRQGPPQDAAPSVIYGALALFWFAGIVIASMALAAPCIRVVVRPWRVEVQSRYPFRTVQESFRPADLSPAEVVDSVDSDGDPYFCVTVRAKGDRAFTLEEGHHRPACESTARRFNRAAGLAPRPDSFR